MEDVLALYHEPYDPDRPVVCFDEHPTQLLDHTREPKPAKSGSVAKEDYHYKREGTQNLFLACEPLVGWRTVSVTDRRKTADWVAFVKDLVDEHYADVECIRLVLDNLSTHKPAAFYEYFEPAEARWVLSKLEFHFTLVDASWLNIAEIEFNVIQEQCLDRRIPTRRRQSRSDRAVRATGRHRVRRKMAIHQRGCTRAITPILLLSSGLSYLVIISFIVTTISHGHCSRVSAGR